MILIQAHMRMTGYGRIACTWLHHLTGSLTSIWDSTLPLHYYIQPIQPYSKHEYTNGFFIKLFSCETANNSSFHFFKYGFQSSWVNINESLMRYPFLAGGEWSTVVQINGNMPQEDPVTHTYIHVLVLLNPRQLLSLPTSKVAMSHQ